MSNQIDAGLRAVVDRDRVQRMLVILVSNAIKHAGVGATIEIRAHHADDGVQLQIDDDGPGVPEAARQHIFAPFTHGAADTPPTPAPDSACTSWRSFDAFHGVRGSRTGPAPQSTADEFMVFADTLGHQLADEGFIDGTIVDATGRVTDALTRPGAIYPAFRPIIALADGDIDGVEALLRFTDHDRPVDLWFADAARAGLLVDLETRAIELALQCLQDLDEQIHVALNVSPRTIHRGELTAVLHDAPMHRLVLEITEHAAIEDHRPLRIALDPLRAQGMRLAIDDVGTGFAGLGHLVQLQPDIIKIDHSLTSTITDDPAHLAAVSDLIKMAKHVDADLVAEGVETPETLHLARDLGFTHAQGFLIARPSADLDLARVRPPPETF